MILCLVIFGIVQLHACVFLAEAENEDIQLMWDNDYFYEPNEVLIEVKTLI